LTVNAQTGASVNNNPAAFWFNSSTASPVVIGRNLVASGAGPATIAAASYLQL